MIDDCDNEILLEEAKELLLSSTVKGWWEELTFEDKNLIMESESQYDKDNFISHQELMKQLMHGKTNSLDSGFKKRLLGNSELFERNSNGSLLKLRKLLLFAGVSTMYELCPATCCR